MKIKLDKKKGRNYIFKNSYMRNNEIDIYMVNIAAFFLNYNIRRFQLISATALLLEESKSLQKMLEFM